jgi:hypothetical protein
MNKVNNVASQESDPRGGEMFNQDQLVRDHIAALHAEAAEERLARSARGHPADAPPGLRRPGVRGAVGRALIALGGAIAATSMDDVRAGTEHVHMP